MTVDAAHREFLSIRGKRRSVSVNRLKHKYRVGDYGEQRALVRVGRGTTEVLIGKDDLSGWDEEELRRGRKRDKNGNFQGRDPVIVAKKVHDEAVKRTLEKANELLTDNLEKALEILVELMTNESVEPKDRIKAIQMITDRAMGKEPIHLDVTGESKWEAAIAHSIVSMPAELIDEHAGDPGDEDVDEGDDQ